MNLFIILLFIMKNKINIKLEDDYNSINIWNKLMNVYYQEKKFPFHLDISVSFHIDIINYHYQINGKDFVTHQERTKKYKNYSS